MELDFTDDQEELRDSVRAVLERECPVGYVRSIVEGRASADAFWTTAVGLDWQALTVPEGHGGIGLGPIELAVVCEELGRALAPSALLPTIAQFVPLVAGTGDEAQRRRFLGEVAAGRLRGSVGVAGSQGSFAPAAAGAHATRNGERWVLSGTTRFVMEATSCDEIAVVARTDVGVGVFVVPAGAADLRPITSQDPSRAYADLVFDGIELELDRSLGAPGTATTDAAIARGLDVATLGLACEMVGTCQAIVDLTIGHARDRIQFGVPIGTFQAVKHKLANMHVAVERARALCYFASACLAEGDERAALAVAMAKAAAGDAQRLVGQDGIQLHGGMGYTWEHDVHLYVKRAKAGDALFGSASVQRNRVAELIGL